MGERSKNNESRKLSEAFEKFAKEKIYNLFNDLPFVNEVSFKKDGLYFF